jgi:hypothetical protein
MMNEIYGIRKNSYPYCSFPYIPTSFGGMAKMQYFDSKDFPLDVVILTMSSS